MTLAELSIKRPVMAAMLSFLFILVGIISYVNLPVQLTPNISYPVITITTEMPGGDSSIINQMVTKPIEEQVNTIAGILVIQSSSRPGKSQIEVTFNMKTDLNSAFNQIDNRINHIRANLPKDARPPLITLDQSNAAPIMLLSLHGEASLLEMDRYARQFIQKKLSHLSGIGQVKIVGVSDQAINIKIDLDKLAANNITPLEVEEGFNKNHVQLPGGSITSGKKSFSMSLDVEHHTLEGLRKLVIAYRNNHAITLDRLADVSLGLASNHSAARFAGQPSVGISIIKKSDSNTLALADEVDQVVKTEIIPMLPRNMTLSTVYNQATYIDGVITQLQQDIWISLLTAAFVIFLFLKNFRSSLIILCSIPISLLGAVAGLAVFGYSLNSITLLALVVLVGIVIDDSIVVLENTARHITEGKLGRKEAAIQGANQVVFAVLASSLTLICIFIPIGFMGGMLAKILASLGFVITVGVIVSFIVSLTLTPVLCEKILRPDPEFRGIKAMLENALLWLEKYYKKIIRVTLVHPWLAILGVIIVIGISVPGFFSLNVSLTPAPEGTGYFVIDVQPPQGFSIHYTTEKIDALEAILNKMPEIQHYFSSLGPGKDGSVSIQLKPYAVKNQTAIMDKLRQQVQGLSGARYFVEEPSKKSYLTFQVRGPKFKEVLDQAFKLSRALGHYQDQLGEVYIHFTPDQPQYNLVVDHILANSFGITSSDVARTLSVMGGEGMKIGHFSESKGGDRYKVLLRPKEGQFISPADMSKIYLRLKDKTHLRLDTIASIEKSLAPSRITRTNLDYSIGFSALPTIPETKAIILINKIAEPILKPGYVIRLSGTSASYSKAEHRTVMMIVLMLIFVYMVLASQFNSFIQPIIVMVAQPLAVVGGVIILWITGEPLSMYGIIGMLLLIGLVSKNSILLVDLTNQLRVQGRSVKDALFEACPTRMRPVIMTALAIIFAMVPAAVSSGPGAKAYHPLAWVIIGGMFFSTILTLVIVPAIYSLFYRHHLPKPVQNKS